MRLTISNKTFHNPMYWVLIILFDLLFIVCNPINRNTSMRDVSINSKSSFNNLFLDSSYLEYFILNNDSFKMYHNEYHDFYSQRNFEFAWFDENGMTEQAHNFYNLQNNLIDNLEDSSIYNPELQQIYERLFDTKDKKRAVKDSIVEKAELLFTGQFFRYANKVYHGSEINTTQLGWFIPRKKINITMLLDTLVDGGGNLIEKQEPLNKQYRLLERELAKYLQLKKYSNWDIIACEKSYKLGDSSNEISIIKHRLFLVGDYKYIDSSKLFDNSMILAVKRFQNRYGIPETGRIGTATIKQINVSPKILITKILINMERARWMPPDTAMIDRVVVNIPEYKLRVYDSGKYSFSMPVVVGTEANNTVIFSNTIRYIVFSPYWNVPFSIIKKDVMPSMQRNRSYLKNHNMEVVKYDGQIPEIRQKPGLNNALGKVKFLFPNKYNIYLHDTPNKNVFSSSKKSFSHGCIRIGNPKRLAEFLLRRQPFYTSDSIQTLMNQTKETWVDAKPCVQVIIKYFTAWVDLEGHLNFRDDIYGHDRKMAEKLFL